MIAYLDASAIVKRYLAERGSRETIELTSQAELTATSIISRAEVAAGLAKAVRTRVVMNDVAKRAQRSFAGDWPDFLRVPVTEALVERAEALAWEHGLRGYDAVHLASALTWQESAGEEVVLAIEEGLMRACGDGLALVIPAHQVGRYRESLEVLGVERCVAISRLQ